MPLHDTADLCSAAYILVAQDPLLKVSSAVAYFVSNSLKEQ